MDDQQKEGGEGDKTKIVHVYPLIKVRKCERKGRKVSTNWITSRMHDDEVIYDQCKLAHTTRVQPFRLRHIAIKTDNFLLVDVYRFSINHPKSSFCALFLLILIMFHSIVERESDTKSAFCPVVVSLVTSKQLVCAEY